MLPGRGLRQGAPHGQLVVAERRGALMRGASGRDGGARAHRLGDDFELVGGGFVVLLLVLDAAVVFQEELTGLLEDPPALADGAADQR